MLVFTSTLGHHISGVWTVEKMPCTDHRTAADMTTAQPQQPPRAIEPGYRTTTVASLVRGALLWTFGVGLVLVGAAALIEGSPGAWGAGIGVSMVCAFFALGAIVVGVAARVAPAASLLVALMTYLLKVVLIGLMFVGLQRSGLLAGEVDANWLAGTLIGCTLVWTMASVLFSMRARQLAYDLPSRPKEASVG